MERKNTMLLTVIAVATLLVAVVGATFAYFTATGDSTANSTVTVTTEKNSAATVESTNASIIVSAAEMDIANKGTTYTVDDTTASDANGELKFTVKNESTTSNYVCKFDLNNTSTGYTGEAADISVSITPTVSNVTDASSIVAYTKSYTDLNTAGTLGDDLTFTVAPGTTGVVTYAIALSVTNTEADQATDLANRSLTTTLTADVLDCVHVEG